MIGSLVGGAVDPEVIKGPRLTDPQQQTSSEGAPIPLAYGTYAVLGTIIQCQSEPTEHKHKDSGKGGPVQETFTYTRTVAIAICRAAPLGGEMQLRRAWVNGKLAYDATGSGAIDADSAKFLEGVTFYSGSETQMPDPDLEALPAGDGGGVGNVPAYRGLCYAVLPDCDVTDSGGAVPIVKWEVTSQATVTDGCIEQNLIAWWPLDDAEPFGTARELIAGRDGVYSDNVGAGAALNAYTSPSAKFTGFDQFMAVDIIATGLPSVAAMDEWTVSAWARPELYDDDGTLVNGGGSVMKSIAGSYLDFFGGSKDWELCLRDSEVGENANMTPTGGTGQDGGVSVDTSAPAYMQHGLNVFIALKWEQTSTGPDLGTYTLYVNGQPVATQTDQPNSEETPLYMVVGGGFEHSDSYQFIGEVSDVKMYDRALSDEEIAAKYFTTEEWIPSPDGGGIYVNRRTGELFAPCHTTVAPTTLDLEALVGDLTERGGVADYDVTALDGIPVLGFAVTQPTNASACLQELQKVYFWDYPEWGNSGDTYTKLRAVLRGGASVVNLTDDDLVDVDDDEDTRRQLAEYPRKVNFIAPDPDYDYEPITQSAERESENVKSTSEVTITTAVVFTRDMAAPIADKMLRIACEEARGEVKRTVPEAFTANTTSDIVTYGGRRYRIDQIDAQDGESTWTMTRDRASAYESNAVGSTGVAVPTPVSSLLGPTMFQALNSPRLESSDSGPGLYIGVCGLLAGWPGCDLYMSKDGGTTESKVATIIDPATLGFLTADLDSGDTLSVQLYNDDQLNDATDEQLALRFNACAVTTATVSEILQFKDTTDTGVKTYDLTTLTRGGLGTAVESHLEGDGFFLLDGSQFFLALDSNLVGRDLIFRPVTRGTVPANNATYTVRLLPQFTGTEIVDYLLDEGGNPLLAEDGAYLLQE